MESGLFLGVGGLLLLFLVSIAGFFLMRRHLMQSEALASERQIREEQAAARSAAVTEALTRQIDTLGQSQSQLAGRLVQMAEQQSAAQAHLNKTLETRLDAVSQRMGQSLTQVSEKTAKSLGDIQARLEVIDKAQDNIRELSGQVIGLQDILSNKQARGAFGEIQLQDLVEMALPPNAYDFQVVLTNGKRADCLIRLPNPPGPIVVDAKFPLESYHALRNAADDQAKLQAERDFRAAIQKHVNDIAERYIVSGETADSALMFLPSEAVYAELHANFSDVVEKSHRARVYIVSPTTMMATLNTVRAILKDVKMREQAHLIQQHVTALGEDVDRLLKRVGNLSKHFEQTSKDVRDIHISADKIGKRVEKVEAIQLGETGDALGEIAFAAED